ncbi:Hypothetical predicted protein [Cloeon dipterum]|uniref:ribonuclease H n=1 Tax=Cloeon dipterum TaxID=197152 RepID=A0A8S1D5W4_9INSE|nr:Hypothetical predicted protein [Cloeon dipterum]
MNFSLLELKHTKHHSILKQQQADCSLALIVRSALTRSLFSVQTFCPDVSSTAALTQAAFRIQILNESSTELIQKMAYRKGSASGSSGYEYDSEGRTIVYTDGSCLNNGRAGAKAGVGAYFGPDSKHNISEPLRGNARPTNINAELQAATRACEQAKQANMPGIRIRSDSEFMIKGVNEWMPKWEKNDWTTSANKPVENKSQFQELKNAMSGMDVKFEHVPAHSNIHGNEMSDRLAKAGAEKYN